MSGRPKVTFRDLLLEQRRRADRESRRPRVSTAADILGPGIAPQAVLVVDWNDDTMGFNGIYYSETGSLNSPDDTQRWIGTCHVDVDGNGLQVITTYVDNIVDLGTWTPLRKARAFTTPGGSTRVFSTWHTV